jgi:hypothetical protein
MKIIEQEGLGLGQGKSGFLTLLVKRQLGEVSVPNAPTYQLDRKEVATSRLLRRP